MSIYRDRAIAYAVIGLLAVATGFASNTFAAQIIQPAAFLWLPASLLMNVWLTMTSGFRDPMKSFLGLSPKLGTVICLVIGIMLVVYSASSGAVTLGTVGVLFFFYAVDIPISYRESWRRHARSEAESRAVS